MASKLSTSEDGAKATTPRDDGNENKGASHRALALKKKIQSLESKITNKKILDPPGGGGGGGGKNAVPVGNETPSKIKRTPSSKYEKKLNKREIEVARSLGLVKLDAPEEEAFCSSNSSVQGKGNSGSSVHSADLQSHDGDGDNEEETTSYGSEYDYEDEVLEDKVVDLS